MHSKNKLTRTQIFLIAVVILILSVPASLGLALMWQADGQMQRIDAKIDDVRHTLEDVTGDLETLFPQERDHVERVENLTRLAVETEELCSLGGYEEYRGFWQLSEQLQDLKYEAAFTAADQEDREVLTGALSAVVERCIQGQDVLPTQEELEQIYSVMSDIREQVGYGEVPLDSPPPPQVRLEEALSGSQSGA